MEETLEAVTLVETAVVVTEAIVDMDTVATEVIVKEEKEKEKVDIAVVMNMVGITVDMDTVATVDMDMDMDMEDIIPVITHIMPHPYHQAF